MVLDDEKKKEIGKRIQKTRKELGFKNGHAFYDFVFGDGEIKTDNKKDSVISEWENGKKYIELLLQTAPEGESETTTPSRKCLWTVF